MISSGGTSTFKEYFAFCNETGVELEPNRSYYNEADGFQYIISTIKSYSNTINEFSSYFIPFINTRENFEYRDWGKEDLRMILCKVLEESHIPYEIYEDSDGLFIFPKGAKELDDGLVSQPLEWLSAYPKAHKTFVIALKQYTDGIFIRDAADNFRKSLEKFFQEFLGNTKNLANNKGEICKYLKDNNAESDISSLLHSLLSSYDTLNNKIAKHNDKVDSKYLEFLMYQTGLFIRMLIVVKQSKINAE